MVRSFTDRVLGGVCGGLAVDLRLNPWLVRLLFAVLTVVTTGIAALTYVALWWALPQESLLDERHGNALRLVGIIVILLATLGAWLAVVLGWLERPLLLPVLLLVLGVVFFLRQLRGE